MTGSDDEKPLHRVNLDAFLIARVPITNAQYQLFVQQTGHPAPSHWEEGRPPKGLESHPVVNVTWHDAVAYCQWLSQVVGKHITLPSEAQWEKAARGQPGQTRLPVGRQLRQPARCNTSNWGWVGTTPVGIFPGGASPYGVLDMSGNVWEWTTSLYQPYPYRADDGRNNPDAEGHRVVRGGSWTIVRGSPAAPSVTGTDLATSTASRFSGGCVPIEFWLLISGFC